MSGEGKKRFHKLVKVTRDFYVDIRALQKRANKQGTAGRYTAFTLSKLIRTHIYKTIMYLAD